MIQPTAGTLFDPDIKILPTRPLSLQEVESLIKRLRAATRRSLRTAAAQYVELPAAAGGGIAGGGGCLCVQVSLQEALEHSAGGRG